MVKIKKDKVLLTPENFKPSSEKFEIIGVFNPGAIRLPNQDILLYVRITEKLIKDESKKDYFSPRFFGKKRFRIKIEKFDKKLTISKSHYDFIFKDNTKRLTYISHLRRVILDKNGLNVKSIDKKPCFFGVYNDGEFGVEDARLTKIGKQYVMTYVSLSNEAGVSSNVAVSRDLKKWKRLGIIFPTQNKDTVIFPEKIKNKYIAFHRPEGTFEFVKPRMWVSYSDDLNSWADSYPVKISKKGEWDFGRVGAGPPPLKTDKGWLLIYHGVVDFTKVKIESEFVKFSDEMVYKDSFNGYYVGAALLDLKNPEKLIAKTKMPILMPHNLYEIEEFGGRRIVFPTGIVQDENKKDLLIYCGGGDRVVSVKKVALDDFMKELKRV